MRLALMLFFMVTCPGPKTRGMGAQADGVNVAREEANPISIAYIPMLTDPPFNSATPILKNMVMVTTFERKFVMATAATASTIITT